MSTIEQVRSRYGFESLPGGFSQGQGSHPTTTVGFRSVRAPTVVDSICGGFSQISPSRTHSSPSLSCTARVFSGRSPLYVKIVLTRLRESLTERGLHRILNQKGHRSCRLARGRQGRRAGGRRVRAMPALRCGGAGCCMKNPGGSQLHLRKRRHLGP